MAISKTQNERPAIIELIDTVNDGETALRQVAQNVTNLTDSLANEISNRTSNDAELQSAIGLEVSNRTAAVSNVQGQIGEGVFSENFTVSEAFTGASQTIGNWSSLFPDDSITDIFRQSILVMTDVTGWQENFKFGVTDNDSVTAGSSISGALTFDTPFVDDSEIAVFLTCVDSELTLTDLSCKLVSATYSGFSYTVSNDSQSDVTIKVGYLAVKVG